MTAAIFGVTQVGGIRILEVGGIADAIAGATGLECQDSSSKVTNLQQKVFVGVRLCVSVWINVVCKMLFE